MGEYVYHPYSALELECYESLWNDAISLSDDKSAVGGRAAFEFFMTCGLTKDQLREIWELADNNKTHVLVSWCIFHKKSNDENVGRISTAFS